MIEISNGDLAKLVDKLPRALALARSDGLTLRQQEDLRQLLLLHRRLLRKFNSINIKSNQHDKK